MKIVFLAPFGIRPKGTVIARMLPLAVELQLLGNEVVIIAPPYTNPEDSGKVEVVEGIELRNVCLGPQNKVLAAPVLAWRMLRAALAESPDVVHLFKPKGYGGLAAMLMIVLRNVGIRLPAVLLDTDDWEGAGGMNDLHDYTSLEKRFYAYQEKWLMQRVAGITVASRELEKIARSTGRQSARMLYLPNCVREQTAGNGYVIRERLGIAQTAQVVLLYTRFFEYEQEKLHAVFASIHQQFPEVRFLVVGKGRNNEEEALLRAASSSGYADSLILVGWVEPPRLPDYLAAGDVAVYPFADTLINRCKCPAKLIELLLAGCPVVGDRIGQIAEYIEDETSGVLCDPEDWQAMARQVVILLNDSARRKALGLAGRRRMLSEFNWKRSAMMVEGFYRAALS